MAATPTCPQCGTELDVQSSPGGLCPRCLLKLALSADREDEAGLESALSELPEIPASAATGGAQPEPPQQIGPYRIVRLLGEGGMGLVYLGEQESPIRRRVAIKLIKLGMDTREVIARFETERQVLALLSHPHIAKVFEAGATAEGRPYFVMEYAEGVPITEYCDRQRLDVRQRLELFVQVCGAVQHAHQKGIIHRDIKPTNLLVEVQNGEPLPKVIDFGIAKATRPRLTEKTVYTRYGRWIGTPAYMSPEQAEMSELEVDSRADIYALGVLLYELLAGALPFDPDRLRRLTDEEVRRLLRAEEPPPPSARLGDQGEDGGQAAEPLYDRSLAIHEKVLGPDHPYVGNNLNNLANLYHYQGAYDRALPLRQRALEIHEKVLGPEHPLVATSLSNLAVTYQNLGSYGEAEPLYRRALKIRERVLGADHVAVAVSVHHLAGLDRDRGFYDRAEPLAARALQVATAAVGAGDYRVAVISSGLAGLYRDMGAYKRAEPLYERALEISEEILGPDHTRTAAVLHGLAALRVAQQRYDDAEELFERALAIRERLHARVPENPLGRADLASTYVALGDLYRRRGQAARAADSWERAVTVIESVTPATEVVAFLHPHAMALLYLERVDEARPLVAELLAKGWRDPVLVELCRQHGFAESGRPGSMAERSVRR